MENRPMNRHLILLWIIVMSLLVSIPVFAQPPTEMPPNPQQNPPHSGNAPENAPMPPPPAENRPFPFSSGMPPEPIGPPPEEDLPAREVLEQVLLAKMAKQLKLNDEQTVILVRRFMEQKDLLMEKTQQRNNLVAELRRMIHGKTKANPTELKEKFDQLLKMDMELAELKQRWIDTISIDLPLESKVQLYLLFSDFENEIRKFLRKAYEWKQNRVPEERGGKFFPDQRRGRPQNPPVNPPAGKE